MLTGSDFLENLKEYFQKNATKIFLPLVRKTRSEGLSKYPVFLAVSNPLIENHGIGVLVKNPTFEHPFFLYLSTLEVLRDKNILHRFNIPNFKKEYGHNKAAFIILNDNETYVTFIPFPENSSEQL